MIRADPDHGPTGHAGGASAHDRHAGHSVAMFRDNVVAIPVAAGLLVPWGIDLPMAVGAIAMSASTIVVAANAQLLRRTPLR